MRMGACDCLFYPYRLSIKSVLAYFSPILTRKRLATRLSEPIPEWLQKRWNQGTLEEDAGARIVNPCFNQPQRGLDPGFDGLNMHLHQGIHCLYCVKALRVSLPGRLDPP